MRLRVEHSFSKETISSEFLGIINTRFPDYIRRLLLSIVLPRAPRHNLHSPLNNHDHGKDTHALGPQQSQQDTYVSGIARSSTPFNPIHLMQGSFSPRSQGGQEGAAPVSHVSQSIFPVRRLADTSNPLHNNTSNSGDEQAISKYERQSKFGTRK